MQQNEDTSYSTYDLSQSPLQILFDAIRGLAGSERDKGTAFENLCIRYLLTEPKYAALYTQVQSWADWVEAHGKEWDLTPQDKGIDLVATTYQGEFHAIQCKFYAPDHIVARADIDSFISASGHKAFSSRILIDTTRKPWGANAEEMLKDQHVPVTRINLADLEASVIDWSRYQIAQPEAAPLKPKHEPRPHQKQAIKAVIAGLQTRDRGKLIMACGTGKTFTALKIAEQQVGQGGGVLFLVPSLALLSQTLTEWSQQSQIPITAFAVCSDSEVGKKREAITDATLRAFQTQYPELGAEITRQAIFHYIYGILHEESYPQAFAHNLTKELPRIPFAASAQDFQAFVEAGKQLADLHINFETGDIYEDVMIDIQNNTAPPNKGFNITEFFMH